MINSFLVRSSTSCFSSGNKLLCCITSSTSLSRFIHATNGNGAGHNKWSKIKRPKMAADLERSKQTAKICSEIMSSVRLGGDNPEFNLRLANVLQRAKRLTIPKATVSNAIQAGMKKAGGGPELGEQLTLAGRGPGGYSLIIEAVTDNKRRTRPEIKSILTKHGADLIQGGASFNFDQKGVVLVTKEGIEDEAKAFELAIIIGAEDVMLHEYDELDEAECYKFVCTVQELSKVVSKAEEEGLDIVQSGLEYLPTSAVTLSSDELEKARSLLALLESHPEVTQVYWNISSCDTNSNR